MICHIIFLAFEKKIEMKKYRLSIHRVKNRNKLYNEFSTKVQVPLSSCPKWKDTQNGGFNQGLQNW